jgi:hypothetical protein
VPVSYWWEFSAQLLDSGGSFSFCQPYFCQFNLSDQQLIAPISIYKYNASYKEHYAKTTVARLPFAVFRMQGHF